MSLRVNETTWEAKDEGPIVGSENRLADIRILIVDDNWFARSVLRNALQALGLWKIVESTCPEDALDKFREQTFDLILMDNEMPDMSGVEFTKLIRNADRIVDPTIPIVMVSSCAQLGQIKTATNAGITEFLAKPFTANALIGKIIACFDAPRPFICNATYVGPCRRRRDRVSPDNVAFERRAYSAPVHLT